jgi:hypothetical protein
VTLWYFIILSDFPNFTVLALVSASASALPHPSLQRQPAPQ